MRFSYLAAFALVLSGCSGPPKAEISEAEQKQAVPQGPHEGPVILSDGRTGPVTDGTTGESVILNFTEGLVKDLRISNPLPAIIAPGFQGFAVHTHAHWVQDKNMPCGTANGITAKGVTADEFYYPQHSLQILDAGHGAGTPPMPVPVSDCDTIEAYLERYDKGADNWVGRSTTGGILRITFQMRYADAAAFTTHARNTDSASGSGDQAWAVSSTMPLSSTQTPGMFQTDPGENFRLQRVAISGYQSSTLNIASGCSAMMILTGDPKLDERHKLAALPCNDPKGTGQKAMRDKGTTHSKKL